MGYVAEKADLLGCDTVSLDVWCLMFGRSAVP